MPLRRSPRQLNQQMRRVVRGGVTDIAAGIGRIVDVGNQLSVLLSVLERLVNMDSGSDFGPLRATLDGIEWGHREFVQRFPAMLEIRQCKDLHALVCARLRQCRFIISMAEAIPARTLGPSSTAALPAHTATSGESCAICRDEEGRRWVKLPCGHAFHRDCAVRWLGRYKAECPMCRAPV